MASRLLLIAIFVPLSFFSHAQDSTQLKLRKNLVKLNLVGITVNAQYERVLSKRIGILIGYKTLPWGNIPFKGLLNADSSSMNTINKLRFRHYAFTPEIRFYFGKKGYGQGFYLAPFYRNAHFETKGVGLDFVKDNGQEDTLRFSAKINGHTFGLLMGAQWNLGKRFVLDVQFFGPHFGKSNLTITGRTKYEMTLDEQDNLEALGQLLAEEARNNLTSSGIPFKNETITKQPYRIELSANSIWAGVRAGVTLGWKF